MTESEINKEAAKFFPPQRYPFGLAFSQDDVVAFAQHCVEKANGWRPIADAPKDGTEFDAWDSQQKERVANVSWNRPDEKPKDYRSWCIFEYESNYGYVLYEARNLTHFMSKPQPPEAA